VFNIHNRERAVQCVAVCVSMLQRVAVVTMLQRSSHSRMCCVLQCAGACCSVSITSVRMQCAALLTHTQMRSLIVGVPNI